MDNGIVKPTSILRYEFIQKLTELINNSKLPPYVVEAVLKDSYNDVVALTQKQLKLDLQSYNEAVTALNNANNKTQEGE